METNILISKFWTRIGALIIDSIILGVIGLILGLTIQDFLIRVGSYGILLGLTITVLYFTIFNSKLFNGQTIGKKAFDIQVTDKSGITLSLWKSLFRALILCVPYFLINVEFPGVSMGSAMFLVKNISCISLALGVMIIYIFNKGNRQSLHDLIIGSYVVNIKRQDELTELPSVTKASYYVFGISVVLFTIFTIISLSLLKSKYSDLVSIQERILKIDGVLNVGVSKNTSTVYGQEESTTKSIKAQLWVIKLPNNSDELENMKETRTAIKTILEIEPNIDQYDIISVTLIKGFNIGIASWKNSMSTQKSPAEWKSLLEK